MKIKEVNHVYETNDYSMFKTLGGNRELNKLHVARLKKSFSENYLFTPILVNSEMGIIDGQHRVEAAKALGLPIRFIKLNGYGLHEIQVYNTNMKNWKKEDYLNGYCDLGFSEYLKFRNFMKRFPEFGIASTEAILLQYPGFNPLPARDVDYRMPSGKPALGKYFEEGKLAIPDYDKSCEIALKILMLKPYYDGFHRRVFVAAMLGLLKQEQFSISELISKLKFNPSGIQHCNDVTQYKLLIENIYNYKRREKVNLRY
jgi:hypothetical protein